MLRIFGFLVLFFVEFAFAQDLPPFLLPTDKPPEVDIFWNLHGQKQKKNDWLITSSWVWSYPYEYNLVGTPMVRLEVRVPEGFKALDTSESLAAQVNPVKFVKSEKSSLIFVDIPLFSRGYDIGLNDRGQQGVVEFRIVYDQGTAFMALHESCSKLKVHFYRPIELPADPQFKDPIAITCLKTDDGLNINIQHQHNVKVSTNLGHLRTGRFRHILELLNSDIDSTETLQADLKICTEEGVCTYLRATDVDLLVNRSFRYGFSARPTFVRYYQSEGPLDYAQTNIDFGFFSEYETSERLMFRGEFASTISPLESSSGGNKKAFFHHAMAVLEKTLFLNLDYNFALLFGGVLESSTVTGTGWGYDGLIGPALGFRFASLGQPHPWKFRGSYSLVGERGANFNVFNAVINGEIKYFLMRPSKTASLWLIPAYRHVNFRSPSSGNSVRVWLSTIGIGFEF